MSEITDAELLKELAKFFLEEFSNNPVEIGDWVAQGGVDLEEFHRRVTEIANE